MQAPGMFKVVVPEIFVTVTPAALDASAAETSMHASTLAISVAVGVGVGEGLGEEVEDEDELDDPHALTRRPATATRAITARAETASANADWIRAATVKLMLGP
jgi:hypothetical protein